MMKSKLFCIGLNKTGTKSLKAALQRGGLKFGDQKVAAKIGERDWPSRNFEALIEYCKSAQAFQDAPFSFPFTYQALDQAFPGSLFIMTVRRSPEDWYSSLLRFHSKIYGGGEIPTPDDLQKSNQWLGPGRAWRINRMLFDSPDTEPYRKPNLIRYYQRHVDSVKEYFRHRPNDLLVLKAGAPTALSRLEKFAGISTGLNKYPHLNRTRQPSLCSK